MNLPLVIAHRGCSAHAPENTIAAFERAVREGADGVEFDVWKCASGEIVVTHNRELHILTGHVGDVEASTLPDLKRLDFGAFKGPSFQGEKIPTLEEVLDVVAELHWINIEIKGKRFGSNGIEKSVWEIIRRRGLLQRTILSSFNPAILFRLKRLDPKLRIGLIFHKESPFPLRQAWAAWLLKPFSLHPAKELLQDHLVKGAHQKKQKVIAWTINNIHYLELCLRLRVDGVITDDPAWMRRALLERGPKG